MSSDSVSGNDNEGVSRRAALGSSAAALSGAALGAGLFTATGCADTTATRLPNSGELAENLQNSSHLFHLGSADPMRFDGGALRGAHEGNFPALTGQHGSAYLARLEPGGIREPHWHPSAWELNYHISGTAKWTILGTHSDGSYRTENFEAHPGDLVFAPQGFLHYFENARTDTPLEVFIVFNTSAAEPDDDIGIRAAINALPRSVLATVLNIPESALAEIPTDVEPVVITKRH
ncbi:cupin domain-containing protein [Nocardia brevicatena]|uniref:cupin domain-containing protein n=1 Tax=Nocardia brevicatena TaxID=37327 RepID=UPI0002E08124|nr:cupin domain-containing protein [Nocardia brevicatena]